MGFFSDFFGGGKGDIQAASDAAMAQLAAGKRKARKDITGGYDSAFAQLTPYDDKGAGFGLYKDSIGANGAEGYQRAFANFNLDPFLAGEQGAADNALMGIFKRYNAGGMGNSGANRLAVSRAAQERYGQNVAGYRQRLAGLGQTGLGVAQTQAGMYTDKGNTLGNLEYGYGQQAASNTINTANAMAAAQQAGANNLLGLLGTGVKAAGLFI